MNNDNQEPENQLQDSTEATEDTDISKQIEEMHKLQEKLVAAYEHLSGEHDKLKKQYDALSRAYTSLQHDYNGQKKNIDEYQKYGGSKIALVLINAIDMFKVALEMTKSIPDINQGLSMSYNTMLQNLASHGIQKIECEIGSMPDPNLHFVMKQEASDQHESGSIIEVLQDGYSIHDRILRSSSVVVAQ